MGFIKDYCFLISGVIIPLITFLLGRYRLKAKELVGIKQALLGITQAYLLNSCEEIRAQGWCSYETKQTLTNLYKGYHELGGDSFITTAYNSCMNLSDLPPETI